MKVDYLLEFISKEKIELGINTRTEKQVLNFQ